MTARWVVATRLEARLVRRHGIVAAVALVTVVWAALLSALPATVSGGLVAAVIYLDAAIVGLLFVGGGVLIERRQGSLEALAVSPLRASDYVIAKLVPLTVLAMVASAVIAAVAAARVRPVLLLAGVVLLCVPVLLVALGVAARATTITAYLFALQLPLVPAAVPLVMDAGWIPVWAGWLGPTTGPYRLLQAATGGEPLGGIERLAAVCVPVVVTAALWRWVSARVRSDLFRAGRDS